MASQFATPGEGAVPEGSPAGRPPFEGGSAILASLLWNAGERGSHPAVHHFRDGRFQPIAWHALAADVAQSAAKLVKLGIRPGDRVALVAENRYEWIVLDLAIMLARAIHVPVHATLAGPQIVHQILDSQARLTILSGQEQAEKLSPHAGDLAGQTAFFALDDWRGRTRSPLNIGKWAEAAMGETPFDLHDALARISADDVATIMYTSGTTAVPRGVMLTHGNLASNALATSEAYAHQEDELRLCFLPFSHIYARTCDLYTWLIRGGEIALARSRETIIDDCAAMRPTHINGVPYFYDKLYRRLTEAGKAHQPGVVQQLLGGRVRYCFSGGAALPEHVEAFFAAQELPLLQGYGLSEASPVITVSTPEATRRGSVGRPIARIEVRIAADGEILTRGPHVMRGYWRDDEATRAAVHDGWLHTGDLGHLDADGFLFITGRKKEMIVTALGKNVMPAALEGRIAASPLVTQVMIVGEGRNFLAALIVPDPVNLRAAIRAHRIRVFTRRGALRHPRVLALYRAELDRLLADLSRHEQVARFVLLGRGFTIEAGELTPKASLCRDTICRHFAAEIESLYS